MLVVPGWQETLLFSEEARVNGDKYPEYYLQVHRRLTSLGLH